MIVGIGTDIVRVSRIAQGLERYGDRFARRIATDQEYADYRNCTRPAHFLAKRFAAKEAAAKAMGTGFRDGMSLRHIGVAHDELGKPYLVYYDRAVETLRRLQIGESFLSLADEDDYAIAYVVITRAAQGERA